MPGMEWVVPPSVSMYADQPGVQNHSVFHPIHHNEAPITLTRMFDHYRPSEEVENSDLVFDSLVFRSRTPTD